MPKSSPTKTPTKSTPYNRSSTSPTPSPTKKRPFTPEEKIALYEVAISKGASSVTFEGVIEGRTGRACYDNWCKTIGPSIKKFLGAR